MEMLDLENPSSSNAGMYIRGLVRRNHSLQEQVTNLLQVIAHIKSVAEKGIEPVCYKSSCNSCKCYTAEDAKAGMNKLLDDYFTENGEFIDENGTFAEDLEGLIDTERSRCNRALPICEDILKICDNTVFLLTK